VEINTPTLPFGAYTVSDNGVLVFQAGVGLGGNQLVWNDRSGKRHG